MLNFFPSREIALKIGPLAVHWYGIMYLLAFIFGMYLLPKIAAHRKIQLSAKQFDSLFIYLFLGVLLGGRLGYVLFYGFRYFMSDPLQIFAVWNGGMASHGGIIGVVIALLVFCRRHKVSFLALGDLIVIPVAAGLALGRIGNFINMELYGTVTSVPWGISVPGAAGLRHPTQIYAVIKDLLLAVVSFVYLIRTSWVNPVGRKSPAGNVAALFLVMYGVLRFAVEYFRDQPEGYINLAGLELSRGQLLTIPVIIGGAILFLIIKHRKKKYF